MAVSFHYPSLFSAPLVPGKICMPKVRLALSGYRQIHQSTSSHAHHLPFCLPRAATF